MDATPSNTTLRIARRPAVARACGLTDAATHTAGDDLSALRTRIHARTATCVAVLKIAAGDQPRTVGLRDGAAIAGRFMQALG